jgi:hypothetical protein
MPISKPQIAQIHVAKSKLGLDDDRYRDLLRSTCGVESSKELNDNQFKKLMIKFGELGFESTQHQKQNPSIHRQPYYKAPSCDPNERPSPAQADKINELFNTLGWIENDRREGFCRRQCNGHPWPQTRDEAKAVTEGLKAIIRRPAKKVI